MITESKTQATAELEHALVERHPRAWALRDEQYVYRDDKALIMTEAAAEAVERLKDDPAIHTRARVALGVEELIPKVFEEFPWRQYVLGTIYDYDMLAAREQMEAEWKAGAADREQYGLYGKDGHDRIVADGELVAQIIRELYNGDPEVLNDREKSDEIERIALTRGLDDNHSGGSWYGVKSSAFNLLAGFPADGVKRTLVEGERYVLCNPTSTHVGMIGTFQGYGTTAASFLRFRVINTDQESKRYADLPYTDQPFLRPAAEV